MQTLTVTQNEAGIYNSVKENTGSKSHRTFSEK